MVTRHTSPSRPRLFNVEQIGEDKTHPGDNLALQRLNYKYTIFLFLKLDILKDIRGIMT